MEMKEHLENRLELTDAAIKRCHRQMDILDAQRNLLLELKAQAEGTEAKSKPKRKVKGKSKARSKPKVKKRDHVSDQELIEAFQKAGNKNGASARQLTEAINKKRNGKDPVSAHHMRNKVFWWMSSTVEKPFQIKRVQKKGSRNVLYKIA